MPADVDEAIEAELARLRSMPKVELRQRYRATFKVDPPKAFGPDLLRRSLAYRIQEQAFGGLDAATRRMLNNLISQHSKGKDGRIVMPRRIKPGAVLVREWKGQSHRVMVLQDGFAYEGKPFASLSEIARLITGARWNGPRFFGLRDNGGEAKP
ncbi:MAG: DUF2924 domain-containing protein [Pseudorhodoplanes sp.]|jgi:hypothetical protein|nr:DUF2924 domain-containing protein [Pseudorhodoplanes sp.]